MKAKLGFLVKIADLDGLGVNIIGFSGNLWEILNKIKR